MAAALSDNANKETFASEVCTGRSRENIFIVTETVPIPGTEVPIPSFGVVRGYLFSLTMLPPNPFEVTEWFILM